MVENLLHVGWYHWLGFGGLVVLLLALDLLVFHRHAHTPTLAESFGWSVFWIALALVFNGLIWCWGLATRGDHKAGLTFLTGYLVEKSLSMDNVFVFAVIFRYFQVPLKYQYRVLFWGILGAVLMRLAFILAGVELIRRFDVLLVVFGLFLVYTGIRLAMPRHGEVHPDKNLVLRTARRFLRVTREDHGQRFFARENGRLCITPLLLVLLVVESTDILFAVDSVPAILGITRDAFIVFSSNVFAILGLRALYFLLAGVMDRFEYLHYGLSAVLAFIGLKMMGDYAVAEWERWAGLLPDVAWVRMIDQFVARHWGGQEEVHLVPPWASLVVVASLLAVSILASVAARRRRASGPEPASPPPASLGS
ncbi:MAG: TerC/Alx family metal homeostasis membrane protein [Thermoguttaceae bacterium]